MTDRPRRIAAIGGVILAALALLLSALVADGQGLPGVDRSAREAAFDVRSATLTEVMLVITDLGSYPTTVAVAAVAAVLLAGGGTGRFALATVGGLALTAVSVQLLKEVVVERPRPTGGLAEYTGAAFPSGHTAKAAVFAYVPLAARDRLSAGWLRVGVVAGVLVALAVGVSRVYLGVHYATDVVGGWATAALAFAVADALARRR